MRKTVQGGGNVNGMVEHWHNMEWQQDSAGRGE
jgi:hypothetical protein